MAKTKWCSTCEMIKMEADWTLSMFNRSGGKCQACVKAYNDVWREENHDKKLANDTSYRKKNREKINADRRVESLTTQQLIDRRDSNKEYRDRKNAEINAIRRKRKKERFLTDFSYRIREMFGNHFRQSLKLQGIEKKSSCFGILGYTLDDLKTRIRSQFEPWMNENNYGTYNAETWDDNDATTWTWQIDHIDPKANFTFINGDNTEIKKCWALTNLRPYSAKQNNIDGGSRIRHEDKGNKHARKTDSKNEQ